MHGRQQEPNATRSPAFAMHNDRSPGKAAMRSRGMRPLRSSQRRGRCARREVSVAVERMLAPARASRRRPGLLPGLPYNEPLPGATRPLSPPCLVATCETRGSTAPPQVGGSRWMQATASRRAVSDGGGGRSAGLLHAEARRRQEAPRAGVTPTHPHLATQAAWSLLCALGLDGACCPVRRANGQQPPEGRRDGARRRPRAEQDHDRWATRVAVACSFCRTWFPDLASRVTRYYSGRSPSGLRGAATIRLRPRP
eukprot:181739-Chlamydomonas_euryale.AAC.4